MLCRYTLHHFTHKIFLLFGDLFSRNLPESSVWYLCTSAKFGWGWPKDLNVGRHPKPKVFCELLPLIYTNGECVFVCSQRLVQRRVLRKFHFLVFMLFFWIIEMICETNILNFKSNSGEKLKDVHCFHLVSDITKNCSINIDEICKRKNVFNSSWLNSCTIKFIYLSFYGVAGKNL